MGEKWINMEKASTNRQKTKSNRSHRAKEYNYSTKITLKGFNNRLDEAEQSVDLKTSHWNTSNQRRKKKT